VARLLEVVDSSQHSALTFAIGNDCAAAAWTPFAIDRQASAHGPSLLNLGHCFAHSIGVAEDAAAAFDSYAAAAQRVSTAATEADAQL
jgi:TPR repeat protein